MKVPAKLKSGDTVAIISPSGIVNKENILTGIEVLKSWGLKIQTGKHYLNHYGRFAGSDKQRLQDLQQAIDNPNIKAIFCSRGGYGLSRILDDIDFEKLQKKPKWLIGYSDISALHLLLQKKGIASLHSFMPASFGKAEAETSLPMLKHFLFNQDYSFSFPQTPFDRIGRCKGQSIGGNLSLISHMIGSKSLPPMKGKILFLEDVAEPMYKIDRMMVQLKRAGIFDQLEGLVFGYFTKIEGLNDFSGTLQETLMEHVKGYKFPVFFGAPFGHDFPHYPIPMGMKVNMVQEDRLIRIVFKK
jgi:muramoyltetrapeptide carboxypeptidase